MPSKISMSGSNDTHLNENVGIRFSEVGTWNQRVVYNGKFVDLLFNYEKSYQLYWDTLSAGAPFRPNIKIFSPPFFLIVENHFIRIRELEVFVSMIIIVSIDEKHLSLQVSNNINVTEIWTYFYCKW